MKAIITGALVALFICLAPGLAAAGLGLLGTAVVWATAQPPLLVFVAGLAAWPRIARCGRRVLRSLP